MPAGWGLKRVKVGALDLTDEGIEVSFDTPGVEVVIARQSEVTGVVTDRQGVPIPGATVVAFAEDQRCWLLPFTRYVRSALSTANGAFTIAGLAPGRYYAAVVPTLIEGRASDPDDLEPLVTGASRFSLGDAERRSLNLRLD